MTGSCDSMATTSIWRVKGWLGKVVIYVENPDKTDNPAFYEKRDMSDRQVQGLSDVIDYAVNNEKTQTTDEAADVVQQFVSGVNCHPGTAREEMLAVKRQFGKEDGTVAYHGYQSFAPGEATPELAHEIGVKLAKQLWGEKYQVIVATHLDKSNHLHNHFVVNTVSFLDGIKYHRTGQDYRQMREASDALCREYGLSVIDQPEPGKSKQYGEWRAEQENRPTWRGMIRAEIDEAIRQSMTERQFFENLRKRGYEIKVGADISVRPPGKPRFVRLKRNFGEDYTLENIRRRILAQQRPERPLPEPEHKTYHARLHGDFKNARKITGFRALYFHYCYLLGIFPKNQPKRNKRIHFLLREDLAKMDAISEEVKLLVGNHIDGKRVKHTVCPVLGEKAAHNGKVVYSLDFEVTPHQLRHTYITNLIHASVDPKTVQYLAGHQNSKITMDIYAKVKYNKPDELAGIMAGAFALWDAAG